MYSAVVGVGMGLLVAAIVILLSRFAISSRARQGYEEIPR